MIAKINSKEYSRLFDEEINNPASWWLQKNINVNHFINDIFEENRFLHALIFDSNYNLFKNESPKPTDYKRFTENISPLINHASTVSFKNNVSRIELPETITGIMSFPNITWNEFEKYYLNLPLGWIAFILNPILMKYEKGSIGLFITPKYDNNHFIMECNSFIELHTGYPLFLNYTDEEHIPEINYTEPELTLKNYVKTMKKYGKNRGLSKLLDFWADNECVKVSSFEYSFNDYKQNLPYLTWQDINFKEIKSTVPFELVHENTGEKLGPFYKFSLDKSFKLVETDKGVFELSQKQVDDLIEGNYDFKFID